jgi:hypothetical protein
MSGKLFGQGISKVLIHRENKKEDVAGKVGDWMSKLLPVMRLALGLTSAGSDV